MDAYQEQPLILWNRSRAYAEQDCACAVPSPPQVQVTPPSLPAAYRRCAPLYRRPLSPEHELIYNPAGGAGVVVLDRPAGRVLDSFGQVRTISQAAAVMAEMPRERFVRAAERLASLDLLRAPSPAAAVAPRAQTLTAWLHLTERCNLACAYCYLDRGGEAMSERTGRAALRAVFEATLRHGYREVKLKYAGGEPLLNFDLLQTLHGLAVAQAAGRDVILREVVLSNGLALTDPMLGWLAAEEIRLMVSLDSAGSGRDLRTLPDGRGSAPRVMAKIDRALAHGLRPTLSITVSAANAGGLVEVVDFALDRELLFNLNFVRVAGGSGLQAEDERLITGVKRAFERIEERMPRQSLIGALVDRASFGPPHDHPCGAGRDYLVIDPRGRVSRCQMEMGKLVSDVWAEDPLGAVRGVETNFANRPAGLKSGCRDCLWKNWCAGGCPLLASQVTGRKEAPSPYCRVYRALLPEALRLEGLRLLEHARPEH